MYDARRLKVLFWWSQTGRRARSLKTGRPVFRYDLTATICTPSIGLHVTQAKHSNSGVFSPRGRTYYARGSYLPLAFIIRVNKSGVNALPPCVLPTFKVHCEYYYREFFFYSIIPDFFFINIQGFIGILMIIIGKI
jgi:hypothetical protein